MSIDNRPFSMQIIGPVEMQEYLFATTEAQKIYKGYSIDQEPSRTLVNDIREILRLHRFTILNWLLMQGVNISLELASDKTHPKVGEQFPDKPIACV